MEVPISPLTLPVEFLHERLEYDPATESLRAFVIAKDSFAAIGG